MAFTIRLCSGCPGTKIAPDSPPFTFYLNDRGATPEQIVSYQDGPSVGVVGVMPTDGTYQSNPAGIAAYAPEPDETTLSRVVLVALALAGYTRRAFRSRSDAFF